MLKTIILTLLLLFSVNAFANCDWLRVSFSEATVNQVNECSKVIADMPVEEKYDLYTYILSTQKQELIEFAFTNLQDKLTVFEGEHKLPIHYAVVQNIHSPLAALKALEKAGISINRTGNAKHYLLYYAFDTNQHDLAKYIISQPKYSEQLQQDENLLMASASNNVELFKILLDQGLDITVTDDKNRGVLTYAKARNAKEMVQFLDVYLNNKVIK